MFRASNPEIAHESPFLLLFLPTEHFRAKFIPGSTKSSPMEPLPSVLPAQGVLGAPGQGNTAGHCHGPSLPSRARLLRHLFTPGTTPKVWQLGAKRKSSKRYFPEHSLNTTATNGNSSARTAREGPWQSGRSEHPSGPLHEALRGTTAPGGSPLS